MEYKYRVSPLGNVFRKAKEGFVSQQMAEEFNFRDKAWKVTWQPRMPSMTQPTVMK